MTSLLFNPFFKQTVKLSLQTLINTFISVLNSNDWDYIVHPDLSVISVNQGII